MTEAVSQPRRTRGSTAGRWQLKDKTMTADAIPFVLFGGAFLFCVGLVALAKLLRLPL